MCIGILLFHETFINENLYPYVYKAVIFVNFHRTEEVDPDKQTPIPHLLYKIASTKLIPLGALRNSSGKIVPGIDISMVFKTISM